MLSNSSGKRQVMHDNTQRLSRHKKCNLCGKRFKTVSRRVLFCHNCRENSEAYKNAEVQDDFRILF